VKVQTGPTYIATSLNNSDLFYDPPVLYFGSLTLFGVNSGVTQGGITLYLNGSNFGLDPYNVITVGPYSTNLTTTHLLTNNKTLISFILPPGVGSGLPVQLTTAGIPYTGNAPIFSYLPPSVTSVTGCTNIGSTTVLCPILGQIPI